MTKNMNKWNKRKKKKKERNNNSEVLLMKKEKKINMNKTIVRSLKIANSISQPQLFTIENPLSKGERQTVPQCTVSPNSKNKMIQTMSFQNNLVMKKAASVVRKNQTNLKSMLVTQITTI